MQIDLLETYILQRAGPASNNPDFLRGFGIGDKYLYSAYDLIELAESVGARLYIQKDDRKPKENLNSSSTRGADENILAQFDTFLSDFLPEGPGSPISRISASVQPAQGIARPTNKTKGR